MKNAIILFLFLIVAFSTIEKGYANQPTKPRVIAMTDGEVDDQSSMVRFLLYTNDVDVEAIIETNSVFQRNGHSTEGWLEKQLDAYEQVYSNLIVHDPTFPTADVLRRKVFVGDEDSSHLLVDNMADKRTPGMNPVIDPANWPNTPGSDRIVQVLLAEDPRPIYIQAWGGGNTAARAFCKLKTDYPDRYNEAISKVVMYNIWYQDGAGSYIEKYHPKVKMLISYGFSGTWDYGSQSFTKCFVENEVKNNHGPLGALYPQEYLNEGDSPSFLYTLAPGLRSNEDPTFGGWGGRFYKVDGFDNVYKDVDKGSYSRWIEFANRDFEARLDWCVSKNYYSANHRPIINVKGDMNQTVKAGQTVELEAEVIDNDSLNINDLWSKYSKLYEQAGFDKKKFSQMVLKWPKFNALWWQYKEAGTYDKMIEIADSRTTKIQFTAPLVDKPTTIHLILEATDRGTPNLTSFARVIVTVQP